MYIFYIFMKYYSRKHPYYDDKPYYEMVINKRKTYFLIFVNA